MIAKTRILFLVVFYFLSTSIGIKAQSIINGPLLAEPLDNSISIRWESDKEADFVVEYGKSITNSEKSVEAKVIGNKNNLFQYEVELANLKQGKKYFYKVSIGDKALSNSTFTIAKRNSKLTFSVVGDSRSKPHIFSAITKLINETDPAAIIANGDLVAKGGKYKHWHSQFFVPSASMIDHIPFLSAVGDHESDNVDGDDAVLNTYYLYPHKNNMKLWFSYNIGDAHFVFLDWRYPNNKEMIEWFKNDMKNSDRKWNFVVLHRSPYNLGGHHVSWGKIIWPDLFQENKIDIVFSGHSHLYERFYQIKSTTQKDSWPVTYITTGGAGASLAESNSHTSLAFSESINHFLNVTIDNNKINVDAINTDGKVIDSVSWKKRRGKVSKEYISTAFSKEEMDVVNVFNSQISQRIGGLPMVHVPYKMKLNLDGSIIKEDVEYVIELAEVSEGKFFMEPVKGTLKKGTIDDITADIYGRSTITISKWGPFKPALHLIVKYKTKSFSGEIKGGRLQYIAY